MASLPSSGAPCSLTGQPALTDWVEFISMYTKFSGYALQIQQILQALHFIFSSLEFIWLLSHSPRTVYAFHISCLHEMHKQPLGQGLKCRSEISTSFARLCARSILCKRQVPKRKKTQTSTEGTIQNTPAVRSCYSQPIATARNCSSHPFLLASLVFPTTCIPKCPYPDCRQVDTDTML